MSKLRILLFILKDPDRKPILLMGLESINLWIKDKKIPQHYFTRYLYRKKIVNYRDYLSTPELLGLNYSKKIQNNTVVSILSNKILFAKFCESQGIPAPKLLGYNIGNHFFDDKSNFKIKDLENLSTFFKGLFEKHNVKSIIIKIANGKGGNNIFQIKRENLAKDIARIGYSVFKGDFIFQEKVQNHEELMKIYPHSLNTLRIDMSIGQNNEMEFLGSVMRFGVNGSFVDNRGQGGFCVCINNDRGELEEQGFGQMKKGGKLYMKHPDTGFAFKGFEIPYYIESINLAHKLSELLPTSIVGWDIAICAEGPIVIEGNHNTNLSLTEVGYGGYRKHPDIRRLLKKLS